MQGVVILFFALIAWGSSLSWGSCYNAESSQSIPMDCGCRSYYCSANPNHWTCTQYPSCSGSLSGFNPSDGQGGAKCVAVGEGSCSSDMFNACARLEVGSGFCMGQSRSVPIVCCTTQNEADSVACVNEGNVWQNGQCQGPIDSSACDGLRAQCNQIPGAVFNGSVDPVLGCCVATCDYCKAGMLALKIKQQECCNQYLAPPDGVRRCQTLSRATCGMNGSEFLSNSDPEFACQDPSLDSTTMQRYIDQCFEPSSSDSQPGSSGSGSSSSGEGGSSSGESPYPEGCDECPWLDSILDTLTLNKWNTDDIVACLTTPGLCAGITQEPDTFPVFAFDTAFNNYLKPLMDSALKVDSLQLKALLKLDTSILKQLKNDTLSLKNDTTTWHRLDALGNVIDGSITTANDTTRKWFRRIADSIGVSTDSLAAHLDSILEHIPDSILDSIVKYQRYATDNFDSVLFGHGKGFSLVDSLIDSSVKYFKESNQKWNEYISMYGDSTQKIHEEIIDLPGRNASAIGSALGYGDTATSTLRGDLNGIREAIEGLGDTNGLGGHGGGYGDSLGRYRDSINKYYISDERFGELVDSTEAAWGVDSLDARWDSSYAYGLCNGDDCPPCSDDSCMGSLSANFVQRADSIARIAGDSLEASTKRQRDSLPTFWDSTFKELKQYSWFGSFDSTFLANIGAKIPNSNTCPEHCFAMDVNGTYAYVGYNMHLDWKLCRPIAPNVLNSLNAFDILKLLARVLTVVTCLSILMWEVSSRRGGGIGL